MRKLSQLVLAQVEADQVLEGTEGVLSGEAIHIGHTTVLVRCTAKLSSEIQT